MTLTFIQLCENICTQRRFQPRSVASLLSEQKSKEESKNEEKEVSLSSTLACVGFLLVCHFFGGDDVENHGISRPKPPLCGYNGSVVMAPVLLGESPLCKQHKAGCSDPEILEKLTSDQQFTSC